MLLLYINAHTTDFFLRDLSRKIRDQQAKNFRGNEKVGIFKNQKNKNFWARK